MNTQYPDFPLHLPLDYTDGASLKVLYAIEVDEHVWVRVLGSPESGGCEWCLERVEGLTFSNSGYGSPESALRDGLVMWAGESIDIDKLKAHARTKTRDQLRAYQPAGSRKTSRS